MLLNDKLATRDDVDAFLWCFQSASLRVVDGTSLHLRPSTFNVQPSTHVLNAVGIGVGVVDATQGDGITVGQRNVEYERGVGILTRVLTIA